MTSTQHDLSYDVEAPRSFYNLDKDTEGIGRKVGHTRYLTRKPRRDRQNVRKVRSEVARRTRPRHWTHLRKP